MKFNKVSQYAAVLISILIVVGAFYYFSDIMAYVLIAWVLSMVGAPLMHLLSKIKLGKFTIGRTLSAILTLVTFVIIIASLLSVFVPLIVEQTNNLRGVNYQQIAKALEEPFQSIVKWLDNIGIQIEQESLVDQLRQGLNGWFDPSKIGNFFGSVLGVAGSLVIDIFSILFISFFFLKEQGLFGSAIKAIVPAGYEDRVDNILTDASTMLSRYFGGILFQMTIITLFVSLGLNLLGVKNALLIGFFAALLNVIPYLGPLIGMTFGVFITISSNLELPFYDAMLPMIGKVVLIFALMQALDNFILQPFIFSNSVLAHPLEIFIIILVGAKLGGIVGMVLAIPAYTIFRIIARTFLSEFKIVQRLTSSMKDRV